MKDAKPTGRLEVHASELRGSAWDSCHAYFIHLVAVKTLNHRREGLHPVLFGQGPVDGDGPDELRGTTDAGAPTGGEPRWLSGRSSMGTRVR